MVEKLCNLWLKHRTKNFTFIPLFIATFDYQKFQKDGKKNSCMLTIHPKIANDQFLKEKLSECADHIRDNYNMEFFTKI